MSTKREANEKNRGMYKPLFANMIYSISLHNSFLAWAFSLGSKRVRKLRASHVRQKCDTILHLKLVSFSDVYVEQKFFLLVNTKVYDAKHTNCDDVVYIPSDIHFPAAAHSVRERTRMMMMKMKMMNLLCKMLQNL
jgi:hypothetical protein